MDLQSNLKLILKSNVQPFQSISSFASPVLLSLVVIPFSQILPFLNQTLKSNLNFLIKPFNRILLLLNQTLPLSGLYDI